MNYRIIRKSLINGAPYHFGKIPSNPFEYEINMEFIPHRDGCILQFNFELYNISKINFDIADYLWRFTGSEWTLLNKSVKNINKDIRFHHKEGIDPIRLTTDGKGTVTFEDEESIYLTFIALLLNLQTIPCIFKYQPEEKASLPIYFNKNINKAIRLFKESQYLP